MATTNVCSPDFHPSDFHSSDFQTEGGFLISFKEYIWDLFPKYFIKNDTYKDKEGRGILQRFITVFGEELDEEVVNKIECYLHIIDAQITSEDYIIHLSDVLGNPPDIFKDIGIYRNLLTYIISVYKIKGTLGAYELFFSILGYGVILTELPITTPESRYDTGGEYDTGEESATYDQTICQPCSDYDIDFYPLDDFSREIDPETIEKLKSVVYFNEPINARLRNFTSNILIEDSFTLQIEDEVTEEVELVPQYDNTVYNYDESAEYDDIFTIGGTPILTPVSIETPSPQMAPNIKIRITQTYAPTALDLTQTNFQATFYNDAGEILHHLGGEIVNTAIVGNVLQGELEGRGNQPTALVYSYVRVVGRVTLQDGALGYIRATIGSESLSLQTTYII